MGVITRFLFVKGTSVTNNQKVNSKISLINKARIGSAIDTPLLGSKQGETGSKAHIIKQNNTCSICQSALIYKAMLHLLYSLVTAYNSHYTQLLSHPPIPPKTPPPYFLLD